MRWRELGAVVCVVCMFGLGCRADPSVRSDVTEYKFSIAPDTIVLEESDGHVVGGITDLLEWHGNLVVVDGRSRDVKVYDVQSGQRIAVIGRTGQGPGEFRSVMGGVELPDGGLAVLDAVLHRVTIFDGPEQVRTSWSLPGMFGNGIDILSGGDLVLGGRLVADEEIVSDSAVHRFTDEGEYVRAYFVIPEPTHFPEGSMNSMTAAVLDSTVIGMQPITNVAVIHDLRTGIDTSLVIGDGFYQPIDWTLEPPVSDSEFDEWIKKQIVAWWLRRMNDELFVAGFQEWDESVGDWRQRWVFASLDGPIAESEPTDFHPAFIRDGRLHSVRIRSDGLTELIIGPAPT